MIDKILKYINENGKFCDDIPLKMRDKFGNIIYCENCLDKGKKVPAVENKYIADKNSRLCQKCKDKKRLSGGK
jgi:hypothetical protein